MIYKKALETFGEENQLRMLQEECAELIHAVSKYLRTKRDFNLDDTNNNKVLSDLCGEIADVEIMLEQVKMLFSSDKIAVIKANKLKRLERLIEIERWKE